MPFFTDLAEIAEGLDLTLRIKRKGDTLTISVLPDTTEKIRPLIVTNTPANLDADFIDTIRVPLAETKQMLTNVDQYQNELKEIEAAGKKKLDDKKSTPAKKPEGPKDKKPAIKGKPAEKKEKVVPSKADKPKKKTVVAPAAVETVQEPDKEEKAKPKEMSLF